MLVWYHLAFAHLATRLAPPAVSCISQQSHSLHNSRPAAVPSILPRACHITDQPSTNQPPASAAPPNRCRRRSARTA